MGIHSDRLFLPPIAQKVVDLCQRALVVSAVHLVGDRQVFVGVDVMKRNCPRFAFGCGVLQALATEEDEESGEAAALTRPGQTQWQ